MLLLPGPRKRVGEKVHTYAHARTKTISRPKYIYIYIYIYIYRELIRESAQLASLASLNNATAFFIIKLGPLSSVNNGGA